MDTGRNKIKNMRWLVNICFCALMVSCREGISPIRYNLDACDFCRMIIMDPRFGGEIVTRKGKVFKFDSAECLAAYYARQIKSPGQFKNVVVSDFAAPGKMMDARRAFFLRSDRIESPMGGNIAAFPDPESARKSGLYGGGQILSWEGLTKSSK